MPYRTRSTYKKSNDKDAAAASSSKKKIGNTVEAKQGLATDSQKTSKWNDKDSAAASSSKKKKKIGNPCSATDSQKTNKRTLSDVAVRLLFTKKGKTGHGAGAKPGLAFENAEEETEKDRELIDTGREINQQHTASRKRTLSDVAITPLLTKKGKTGHAAGLKQGLAFENADRETEKDRELVDLGQEIIDTDVASVDEDTDLEIDGVKGVVKTPAAQNRVLSQAENLTCDIPSLAAPAAPAAPAVAPNLRGKAWDSLADLTNAGFYEPAPSSIKSPLWYNWRKLSPKHPQYDGRPGQFQCVHILRKSLSLRPGPRDGICGVILRCRKAGKWFSSSNLTKHMLKMHKEITKKKAAQFEDISAAVVAPAPKQSPFGVDKRLNTVPIALMKFIIYSKTNQPLSVCDCPQLQALCEACWSNARLPNSKTLRKFYFFEYRVFRAILQIELNLCKIYYSGMPFSQIMHDGGTLKNKQKYQTMGLKFITPFNVQKICYILHRALCNNKNVSVEEMFSLEGVKEDIYRERMEGSSLSFAPLNISVSFHLQEGGGKAEAVGKAMTKKFREVTNLELKSIARNAISDAAALSVAQFLGRSSDLESDNQSSGIEEMLDPKFAESSAIEEILNPEFAELSATEETLDPGLDPGLPSKESSSEPNKSHISARLCDMHNLSKVIRWAIGSLQKSRNKEPYLPFEEGRKIILKANAVAKHFNYGERRQQLRKLSDAVNCPLHHPHVNVNGTRVMAEVRVLTHVVQKESAINACVASNIPNAIAVSKETFGHMAELEALGFALGKFVYTAQTEKSYTGAYRLVMYIAIRKLLDKNGPGIPMFVRPVTRNPPPQRKPRKYEHLSHIGQKAWNRAESELEFRMRKSNISLDEIISLLGDVRLARDQSMYVAEGVALNIINNDTLINQVAEQWNKFYNASISFLTGATSEADSETSEGDGDTSEAEEAPVTIFGTFAPTNRRQNGDNQISTTPLDILQKNLQDVAEVSNKHFKDLTPMEVVDVDIGPHYSQLIEKASFSEKENVASFVSFLMSRMGDNMAESYNERQIHVCNQIMTADRTCMDDDLLEILAVLRMNRTWLMQRKKEFALILPHLNIGGMEDYTIL